MSTYCLLLGGSLPPSKKNHHKILKFGKRIIICPDSIYVKWERATSVDFRAQWLEYKNPVLTYPLQVTIQFFYKTMRRWDLTNRAESVMDALKRSEVIKDDNIFCVNPLQISASKVDNTEGTSIIITELNTKEICTQKQ